MTEDLKELRKAIKEKDYKEVRWCVSFILLSPIRALGFIVYALSIYGEPLEHQLRDM